MTALEDRLRSDLPALADAQIGAREDQRRSAATADGRERHDRALSGRRPAAARTGTAPSWRRPLAGAVAAVVVAGLLLGALVVTDDRDRAARLDVASTGNGSAGPEGFGTWSPMVEAPIAARAHPVPFWTGSEAVFWAGTTLSRGFAYVDAAAYDPETGSWRTVEALGWGHPGLTGVTFEGELYALAKGHGARFDPDAGTWTALPPVDGMLFSAVVASDDAVWGLGPAVLNPEGQPDLAIARYDAGSHRWVHAPAWEGTPETAELIAEVRRIERPVVWSGSEIVVWGKDRGLGFDPRTERWRMLPALVPPVGQVTDSQAVVVSEELLVIAGIRDEEAAEVRLARLSPDHGWVWASTSLPDHGMDAATVVGAGEWLAILAPDRPPITVHVASGAWAVHEDAPLVGEAPGAVWTGEQLIVWGGVTPHADGGPGGATWTPPSR